MTTGRTSISWSMEFKSALDSGATILKLYSIAEGAFADLCRSNPSHRCFDDVIEWHLSDGRTLSILGANGIKTVQQLLAIPKSKLEEWGLDSNDLKTICEALRFSAGEPLSFHLDTVTLAFCIERELYTFRDIEAKRTELKKEEWGALWNRLQTARRKLL